MRQKARPSSKKQKVETGGMIQEQEARGWQRFAVERRAQSKRQKACRKSNTQEVQTEGMMQSKKQEQEARA